MTSDPVDLCHLTRPTDFLLNNIRAGKGFLTPVSAIAAEEMEGITTPYAIANGADPKEQIWEDARRNAFGHLPPRLKSLFAFQSREHAMRAMAEWFPGEERALLRLYARQDQTHTADARLLDESEEHWPMASRRYWAGEMTTNPRPEVIIGSLIYFPDWQRDPELLR